MLFFAVWPAKLMQKQMVSNMDKKKGKCDKPKGYVWLAGGVKEVLVVLTSG